MSAAFLLRLQELRRRGGLALLAAAAAAILLVGLKSYGLASDLAVTLGYVAALLFGAFPLAIDRERRRSYLAQASPVAPWAWALGSAAGTGAAAALATFVLFAAAGAGAAAAGGIETNVAYPLNDPATIWLTPEREIGIPADAHALRTHVRAVAASGDVALASGAVRLLVDGRETFVPADEAVSLPARHPSIRIRNPDRSRVVGLAGDRTRALGSERSFLWNAILAGLAPALAAFGLAALGVAAGANLSAPVASLLVATFVLVASLKGFLLETWEHEGKVAAAVAGEEDDHEHGDHAGHDHGPVGRPRRVQTAMRTLLVAVPDLPALDASDRVARGEWAGTGAPRDGALYDAVAGAAGFADALGRLERAAAITRLGRAAAVAAVALLVAAAIGGLGVHLRRTS